MPRPPFLEWATEEIARLRELADSLEQARDLYLGKSTLEPQKVSTPRAIGAGKQRESKYEAVFQAFEREGRALSMDDMIEIARREGFELNRANMRSQVFAQKNAGRTKPDGDRYIWGLSKTEPAPPEEEAPVP